MVNIIILGHNDIDAQVHWPAYVLAYLRKPLASHTFNV